VSLENVLREDPILGVLGVADLEPAGQARRLSTSATAPRSSASQRPQDRRGQGPRRVRLTQARRHRRLLLVLAGTTWASRGILGALRRLRAHRLRSPWAGSRSRALSCSCDRPRYGPNDLPHYPLQPHRDRPNSDRAHWPIRLRRAPEGDPADSTSHKMQARPLSPGRACSGRR
jgi:hypothetical protein